ncbi:MAG TPA: sugar ABC transporter substrate-binding protein [Nitrospirae bacterium]|nr:sugar ABC transporter substrate-binding protein [Nitrospirota bacterium]
MVLLILGILLVLPVIVNGEDYTIGEGDVLGISVWGNDKLSLSVKVRPDGKITIPASGEFYAAGLSPIELQDLLSEKLKGIVKNPVVTVIVEEINNNKVYVFGGGVSPGVVDLNKRTTLLQLLCQIGNNGNTVQTGADSTQTSNLNNADLKKAYVLRKGKKIKEDFYGLFVKGDVENDILMKPDDIVFIPAFADRNIYVVGAVNEPKFIEYREGLTIMEAILGAGGFTKFARKNNTVIYRKDGRKEITIPVKLDDLIKDGDMTQNLRLNPGDYIVVKEGMF